nr:hypothetical protein CFP56_23395 [Quercus suber]
MSLVTPSTTWLIIKGPQLSLFCCSLFEQEQKQKPSWSFVVSKSQICLYSARWKILEQLSLGVWKWKLFCNYFSCT